MCVTLESFIFTTLIEYYTKHHKGWKIDIDVLQKIMLSNLHHFYLYYTIQRAQADTGENIFVYLSISTQVLFLK